MILLGTRLKTGFEHATMLQLLQAVLAAGDGPVFIETASLVTWPNNNRI